VVEIIVYKDGTDPKDPDLGKKVAFSKYISTGIGFGEIALLYNDKRTATVRAAEPCQCWVLEGRTFKNIIIK
jgi:CRP-like cAMP-binding protein